MATGQYGIGAWGTGAYGAAATSISIDRVVAVGTNRVRVTLTAEPKHEDPFAVGDALNPQTWTLTNLETGQVFTILAVRDFDPPVEFELATLEDLGSHLDQHRLESSTLLSSDDILISDPNEADFVGAVTGFDPLAVTAGRNFQQRDLANPPFKGQGGFSGTLIIDSSRDYATETGAELVRKLVIRRLVTQPGEFFHLPDYGVGLAVKEPVPGGGIVELRAEIERQSRLEPDVRDARANLTINRSGVLTLLLRVQLEKTGQQIEIGLQANPRSGQVVEL